MNKHKLKKKPLVRGCKIVEDLLNTDPIETAEKEFGKNRADFDEHEMRACMVGGTRFSELKVAALQNIKDTYLTLPFKDLQKLLLLEGFVLGYAEEFRRVEKKDGIDTPDDTDTYEIYYRTSDGLVVEIESFDGTVNCMLVYGNIIISHDSFYDHIFDMCIHTHYDLYTDNKTVSFCLDGREACFHKLELMKKYGIFKDVWTKKTFTNLSTRAEERKPLIKKAQYLAAVTEKKISKFPDDLKGIIKVYLKEE